MTAIILAGGFGSRLQSVVSDVPKPMAPVNAKPFLTYIFEFLKKNGIENIILSVGYKHEIIQDYFGDIYNGMTVQYVIENDPLGTGGAIKKALSIISDEDVFVINGDTYFDIDLFSMKETFSKASSRLFLSVKQMENSDRYGSVVLDNFQNITSFEEKAYKEVCFINGGIYLLKRIIFDAYELPLVFSFEEFMQKYYSDLKTKAMIFSDYFIDIGIPEDYDKAQEDFK